VGFGIIFLLVDVDSEDKSVLARNTGIIAPKALYKKKKMNIKLHINQLLLN